MSRNIPFPHQNVAVYAPFDPIYNEYNLDTYNLARPMVGGTAPGVRENYAMQHGRYLAGLGMTHFDSPRNYPDKALDELESEDDTFGSGIFDSEGTTTVNKTMGIFEDHYNIPGWIGREVLFAVSQEVADITNGAAVVTVPSGGMSYIDRGLIPQYYDQFAPTLKRPEYRPPPPTGRGDTYVDLNPFPAPWPPQQLVPSGVAQPGALMTRIPNLPPVQTQFPPVVEYVPPMHMPRPLPQRPLPPGLGPRPTPSYPSSSTSTLPVRPSGPGYTQVPAPSDVSFSPVPTTTTMTPDQGFSPAPANTLLSPDSGISIQAANQTPSMQTRQLPSNQFAPIGWNAPALPPRMSGMGAFPAFVGGGVPEYPGHRPVGKQYITNVDVFSEPPGGYRFPHVPFRTTDRSVGFVSTVNVGVPRQGTARAVGSADGSSPGIGTYAFAGLLVGAAAAMIYGVTKK